MATATRVRLTEEEFLSCPDWEGYELVDGEPVEVGMSRISAWVGGELLFRIRTFLLTHPLGRVFPQDTPFRAWPQRPNHFRKPDVMFFASGRLPGPNAPDGTIDVAPDLAVEVVSPNDNAQQLDEKVKEYLEAGVRLVWVIYPDTQVAYVYRQGEDASRISPGGTLKGEDVIPGFTLPLSELFGVSAG